MEDHPAAPRYISLDESNKDRDTYWPVREALASGVPSEVEIGNKFGILPGNYHPWDYLSISCII